MKKISATGLLKSIKQTAIRTFESSKKKSPEIFLIAGLSGVVIGTVVACVETRKAEPIFKEHKEAVKEMKEKHADPETPATTSQLAKDYILVYGKTGAKLVKTYWKAAAIEAVSIGLIGKSYGSMKKRNLSLAAYAAGEHANFENYRKRVIEKYGDEIDKEFRYNTEKETLTEEVTDDETGKKKKKKTVIDISELVDDPNGFIRYFCKDTTRHAEGHIVYDKTYCENIQAQLNSKLELRYLANGEIGKVYINEILDDLGIVIDTEDFGVAHSAVGQICGYYRTADHCPTIDLGLADTWVRRKNGTLAHVIVVEFLNNDGYIAEL